MKTATHHRPLMNALALGLLLLAAAPARADIGSGSATAATDSRDYTLVVASAHGTPVPVIGTNTYAWRATVTASVEAVSGAYTCTGWTGSGAVPLAGVTTNTGPIELNTLASGITWQWEAQGAPDTDLDGLPDEWEIEHFGSITVSDGTGDFDGDGRTDGEELADNTDPANAGSTLGLVLYYPMDGNANDMSGGGNTGTVVGATLTTDRFNHVNSAYGFDGTDHIESQLYPTNVNPNGNFSYSFWMQVNSTTNWTVGQWYVDAKPSSSEPRVSFGTPVATNQVHWYIRYTGNINPAGGDIFGGSVILGAWKHYLVTREYGVSLCFYENGQLISTRVDLAIALPPPKPVLGAHGDTQYNNRKLIGAMDEFRIYNRALSSNEVARLYDSTSAQPTTHLVTLHPGDHGSISNANSGVSYVTNVVNGAAFPTVQVNADAGWTFAGWNPAAPETVTNAFTATAGYDAVAQARFQLVRGSFTWPQAKTNAQARGGHLATITSEEEWQVARNDIADLVGTNESWWLGGTDEEVEGVWKWVTGEPWGFTRWFPGEPIGHGEDYLQMYPSSIDFRWNDAVGGGNAFIVGYVLELEGGVQPPAPRPDLSLGPTDLRILNASGVETANPSIGEKITFEVTLHNTGETNTTGNILVQLFHNGAPTNLIAYNSNDFSVVASAVVAESIPVGGSRKLQLAWTTDVPARVVTLAVVAEFSTNRAASQAGSALPYPEAGYANNAVGRSIQIGSPPAGQYRIAVRPTVPTNMQSGVRYTLAGTAVYNWGSTSAVIAAQATIGVNGASYTNRTAFPNGAWSVLLNGLPAGDHVAHIQVDDGGRVGTTNVLLSVSPGPATVDLHVKQIAFVSGTYRTSGETGYAVTGTPVVLKALIRNDGNTNSGNFAVDFRDSSNAVVSAVTTSLAAFSETWVTATAGWAAVAGSHALIVVADSGNSVTNETSESNNERACTVIGAAALPDLIVSAITWSPDSPKDGDTVTLTATVHNQGAAAVAAGTSFASAFSPGGTVTTNLAADLAPGASLAVRTTWAATAGSHTVSATADSGSAVAEDSESNNNRTETLFVRQALPDLRPSYLLWGWRDVSGLSFSPSQPVAGEPVTVTCDIYNSGTVPLASGRSFSAVFSADGIPFATNTVVLAAELAVGGKVATSTNWSGAAGPVTFAVTVDTAGAVTEENEGNNGTALGLTVYPAGALLAVYDLAFSPYQPYPGSNVTLTAVIQNNGGFAGGAGATVTFYADSTNGSAIGQASLAGDIAPKGGTGSASIEWTAPGSATNVTIYAVIAGSERHESLTVTATPAPNLRVYSEDISFSPSSPERGDRVTVLANIRNTEGSSATNFHVRFAYDASAGDWVDLGAPVAVTALAAGSSLTVTGGLAIAADRSAYSVLVQILPNDVQGDANSNDNAATSSFLLSGTPSADAGEDVAAYVGQTVVFDGSGSTNATSYAWTLASAPSGSTGTLAAANTATPSLVPDRPGLYELRLIVSDGVTPSESDTVVLTASWLTLEIASPHGEPTPATGLYHYAWAAVVACQSPEVAEVAPHTTQHVCLGWTGAGSVPTNGAATNVTFTITNHSTLAWRWSTNYWLEVAVVGSGSVDVASGWFASGSNVVLTAAPDAGHCFTVWSGDTNACTIAGAEIAAPMTGPRSVRAAFVSAEVIAMVAALLRGSLEDQEAHGLYTPDALRNLFASPLLIAVDPVTGKIQLDLQMQWTDDLTPADWQPLGEPIRWSDTNTAGKAFYRLLLREPGEE